MSAQTIIINARYVPEAPSPAPSPLILFTTRYDQLHPGKPNNQRAMLEDDARRLASAVLSWKHPTDFFESFKGQQLSRDFDNSWSRLHMAKKTVQSTFSRPEWKGFLERPMTEQELTDCDNLKLRPVDVFEHVNLAIANGFDVSLSYQARDRQVTVTLKDQRPQSPTAGYALSARGTDALDALKLALYKHEALLAQDWSSLLNSTPKTRRG